MFLNTFDFSSGKIYDIYNTLYNRIWLKLYSIDESLAQYAGDILAMIFG